MQDDELGYFLKVKGREVFFRRESARETRELRYTAEACIGCGLCYEACPVRAIKLGATGAITRRLMDAPPIEIDAERCVLCGVCSAVCMFNAIDVLVDDSPVKGNPEFPNFLSAFVFNQDDCKMKDEANGIACDECKRACPREAITFAGIVERGGKKINTIERDEAKCVFCSSCSEACPTQAIAVEKVFEGEVKIDHDTCTGCASCVDICPTRAMYMPRAEPWEKPAKVEVREQVCIYCGACEHVCPVDAIDVERTRVNYSRGEERSWTKKWEKIFREL
ncbi:4Fe-4S binding protein [Candidatus Pyrohabitans sp.]